MFPFLQLGPIRVPSYGLLLCAAIIVGAEWARMRAPRYGLDPRLTYRAASLAVLAALVGANLSEALLRGQSPLAIWRGGNAGTFLAGFLMAFLVTATWARRAGVSFWRLGDCFAPSLALGTAIVRVGCFAASCDYGRPTKLFWGVVFRNPIAAEWTGVPLGVPLHPTQLLESALGMVILGALLWLERKPHPAGALFLAFISFYAAGRFLLEFLRGDASRGFWGPLSTSQWLSLLIVPLVLLMYRVPASHRSA